MGKYNADGFRFMGTEMYEFAKMMAEHLELQDAGAFEYELDEIKAAKMKRSYELLKELCKDDPDAEIEVEKSELLNTDYVITLRTFYISFADMSMLCEAIKDATNIDFVAHTDGSVEMGLMFQNVLIEKLK